MVLQESHQSRYAIADEATVREIETQTLFMNHDQCSAGLELKSERRVAQTAHAGKTCCVAVEWQNCGTDSADRLFNRAEFVIEQVGLQVGIGVMLQKCIGSDFSTLTSYPHCWEGGMVLFASGNVVHNNRVIAETGLSYGTFENGDRVVLERSSEGYIRYIRIRHDPNTGRTRQATLVSLPTEQLVGEGSLSPYLLLAGISSTVEGRARLRCIRSALPAWRPCLSFLYPSCFVDGIVALRLSWQRILPTTTDDLLLHNIIPFCGREWFADTEETEKVFDYDNEDMEEDHEEEKSTEDQNDNGNLYCSSQYALSQCYES